MKIRALAVTALSAITLLAGVAQAQDMGMGCPGGLSADDCAVISGATMNTLATVTSFKQDWTIDFSATGIPDSANEGQTMEITFQATGSGPVVLDLTNTAMPFTAMEQKVTVNASGAGQTIAGDTGVIIKDGMMYLDFGGGNWMSLDLAQAMEGAMGGGAGSMLPVDPAALMSGDDPQVAAALGAVSQLAPLAEVPGFMTYTRDGDAFTFVVDFPTLFTAPEFSTTLSALSTNEDANIKQVAGIAQLLPMVVQEGNITVVQTVDSAANVVTGIDFNVNLSVNAAMLAPTATDPIVVKLAFSVDLSEANGTFDIQAPASSTPLEGMGGM